MTATPAMQLGPNHKYCPACATVLDARAPFCQKCGAPQQVAGAPADGKPKSKLAAALIAFFLGGFGVHRFYLGQWGWGLLMMLTFWTFIPSIVALVDFIRYLVMDEAEFHRRYGGPGGGVVPAVIAGVVGPFGIVAVTGILAAIAIPNFLRYQLRAKDVGTRAELQAFFNAQEAHRQATGAYLLPPAAPVPNDAPLGSAKMAWNDAEQAWARELSWPVGNATYAQFAIAVNPTENAAASFCAETDLDGDGQLAAWIVFRPHLDGGGSPEAPPPAPCSEDVALSPEFDSLEYVEGLSKIGEPIRVSPPDVF